MAIPNTSGLRLFAAIRKFSESSAWAELEELLGLGVATAGERASSTADDWARRDFQVMLKLEAARVRPTEGLTAWHRWIRLRIAFKARLQSGELVATGYVKPVELAHERTAIPSDKWRFLELDIRNGAARGEGLEIVSIIVSAADRVDQTPSDSAADPYRTGLPGRRTIKHLIVCEFRSRVERGCHELSLKAEAQALETWARQMHPEAPTPRVKTIENQIRPDYNRLVVRI